jgi:hypothetical protein
VDEATGNRVRTLLVDIADVGREEKCRTCHCYLAVLCQAREAASTRGFLHLPEADGLAVMVGRVHAALSHACLGCDPCLPVGPFNGLCDLFRANPPEAPPESAPT